MRTTRAQHSDDIAAAGQIELLETPNIIDNLLTAAKDGRLRELVHSIAECYDDIPTLDEMLPEDKPN